MRPDIVNTKTSEIVSVPRRFLGEVSPVAAPVIIVGLVKELEYREGVVYPHVRRVIEMPRAVNDSPRPRMPAPEDSQGEQRKPAMVVGIRVESGSVSRTGRVVRGAIGAIVCVAVAMIFHEATIPGVDAWSARRSATRPVVTFTANDDYQSIVNRLGQPRRDQWLTGANGAEYRRLWYPRHAMAIILMGSDREHAHYAGALGRGGRVIHSIGSAADLLSHLR